MYKIPADTKEKEKIIGGLLTLVQFLWLLGGFIIGLVMFVITWLITGSLFLGLSLMLAGIGLGAPFAFYKKKDLTFFQYLTYKRKLERRNVNLLNNRIGGSK